MSNLSSATFPSTASGPAVTLHGPDTPGPGPWIDGSPEARIEELEEMMRRIMIVVHPDPRRVLSETDNAVLAMAADALGLDTPIALAATPRNRAGGHLYAV